ncbi:MAG: hypothetical protein BWK76_16045 [Desulfobulbaceae bacterium A2]|nr:MAG: hypothetical protein BWK76_16045 [Desulfobulbaceae bacterium A2]
MKYLMYILVVILGGSLLSAFFLLRRPAPSAEEIALVVNDRRITTGEYNNLGAARTNHSEDDVFYRETVIARELLIQEGKRIGIDQEEDFRRSIQRYYEQSLIKVLMDRQFATLKDEATQADIDRYLELYGSVVSFTLLHHLHEGDKALSPIRSESHKASFAELSSTLRTMLLPLSPGSASLPAWNGMDYESIRLDTVEPAAAPLPPPEDLAALRQEITEARKELRMNEWLAQLRKNAVIVIPPKKQ